MNDPRDEEDDASRDEPQRGDSVSGHFNAKEREAELEGDDNPQCYSNEDR